MSMHLSLSYHCQSKIKDKNNNNDESDEFYKGEANEVNDVQSTTEHLQSNKNLPNSQLKGNDHDYGNNNDNDKDDDNDHYF